MSYVVLRVTWCYIIVLNVHEPTEEKHDSKDMVFLGIRAGFQYFPRYHMTNLLRDFNVNWKGGYFPTDTWELESASG
jgi:hypothetical protein